MFNSKWWLRGMDWNTIVDPCQLQNCSSSLNKITVLNFFLPQSSGYLPWWRWNTLEAELVQCNEELWCKVRHRFFFVDAFFGVMDPSFTNTFWHSSVLHFNEYKDNSNQLKVQLGHSPIIGRKHKTLHITCAPQPTVWVHVYRLSTEMCYIASWDLNCKRSSARIVFRLNSSQFERYFHSNTKMRIMPKVNKNWVQIVLWLFFFDWLQKLHSNCVVCSFQLAYYIFHRREPISGPHSSSSTSFAEKNLSQFA